MDRARSIGAAVIWSMRALMSCPASCAARSRCCRAWRECSRSYRQASDSVSLALICSIDVRVQGLPDGGGPQGEQVAGSAGPVLGLADLLGGGQVAVVAAHDADEDGFGGGLLVGLVTWWCGGAGDDVGGVGFAAAGHADVQGLPGQGVGDQEVGGVDGAALGDVDVAGVGELGVAGEVGPGDPERPGPGPVQALPPDLGVGAAECGDLEGVAVGELAAAGVDLGVEAGADQVADAGVVAVGQRGLRRPDACRSG